jgi:uncharacterized protein YuzE
MKHAYLEVTYRKGRAVAAYYYLPRRDGDKSVRTERVNGGLLVDLASDGRAIGIEISSPSRVNLPVLNKLLVRLGFDPIGSQELGPLAGA